MTTAPATSTINAVASRRRLRRSASAHPAQERLARMRRGKSSATAWRSAASSVAVW